MPREIIQLQCTECKNKNYSTTKNKRKHPSRMEVKKYCPFDRRHTVHREVK
ncbi:MAG: 50S ribosomal protein L33 [Deltaproteobacteria bacterium]|nr:50S ribosomal protein L33 [Deltaproteobacteria bacterium]